MKHTLQTPLAMPDGTVLKTVEVKSVKVKHLKAAEGMRRDEGDMMAGIALLAAVTELPIEVVEEMDARDFTTLSEGMAGFLPKPA